MAKTLFLLAASALAGVAHAQLGVGSYAFTQNLGAYVPITGGTVLGTGTGTAGAASLDDVNYAVPLPFTFTFDGVAQMGIYVNTNGHLTFGTTPPAVNNWSPLSYATAYAGAASAFGRDLQAGWSFACDRVSGTNTLTNVSALGPMQVGDYLTGNGIATGAMITAIAGNTITMSLNATSTGTAGYAGAVGPWAELRYETLGTTPNQVFVVQWTNFKRYGWTTLTTTQHMVLNFQIRLEESTNKVQFVYGNCSPGLTTFTTVNQVGLRGPTNAFPANINNRLNTKGVNDDWLLSLPGTSNTSGMLYNNVAPANVITSGLTYEWGPPVGAYAGFTATPTGGPTPLTVQFTDSSFTTHPGGIIAWAWDLDGDSVIDTTLQNPSWVYNTCGNYTVSLTVIDGVNPANTLTRTSYIQTDRITANFTSTLIGPLTMQFIDTSSMPATTWSWDLNGDLVPDSTVQNPIWVYPNANAVNVTLTVTRLCSPPSSVTKSSVPVQSLSHNVAPNNTGSNGAMVFFDLNVTNPQGVEINSMDVFASLAATAFTVDVYMKQGNYLTFEKTPGVWTKVGTGSGTSTTNTTPSPVALAA
ncbi:MAG: PKD domain-containing protein, partial [Planctomycetes bacterium]|nr:PKD domain-containing protein [Planctomycetota bacterium]